MAKRTLLILFLPILHFSLACQSIENGFFNSEAAEMVLPVHETLSNEAFKAQIEAALQKGALESTETLSLIKQALATELGIEENSIILESGDDAPRLKGQESFSLSMNVVVKRSDASLYSKDKDPFFLVSTRWRIHWRGRTSLNTGSDQSIKQRLQTAIEKCVMPSLGKQLEELGGKPEPARWKADTKSGISNMYDLLPPQGKP